jgi:nitrate reductase NapA
MVCATIIRCKRPPPTPTRASWSLTFAEYAAAVNEYTLEKVSEMSGVPAAQLERLARQYADPNRKVMSLWTMGFNQHTRGSWVNSLM